MSFILSLVCVSHVPLNTTPKRMSHNVTLARRNGKEFRVSDTEEERVADASQSRRERNARSRSIRVSSAYVRSVTATRVLRERCGGRGRDKGADREGKREKGKTTKSRGDHGD